MAEFGEMSLVDACQFHMAHAPDQRSIVVLAEVVSTALNDRLTRPENRPVYERYLAWADETIGA